MKYPVILRHILFWLIFFSVSLYNELYLSPSFNLHPSLSLLLQTATAIALICIVKVIVVYVYLYLLIPLWVDAPGKVRYYIAGLVLLLAGTFAIRVLTQQVIWKHVYGEAAPELHVTQVLARYFYSLLDLLLISAICIAGRLFLLRINAVKREKALVREKLNAEMLQLKAQTNPHFLFNTLNTIYALSRHQSPHTSDAIMKLSKILRYMLYETQAATKPLAEEINILRDFVALQELRFGDRIQTELLLDIDRPAALVAPLLLLPLMENAYKHSNSDHALIRCSITLKEGQFSLKISNPVAPVSVVESGTEGIGLGNIRRQLELLYRKFSLVYGPEKNNFIVALNVDLDSYAENELFDHRG